MRKSTRIKRSVVSETTADESREEENDTPPTPKQTKTVKEKTTPKEKATPKKKTTPKKKATPKKKGIKSNEEPNDENVISSEEPEKKQSKRKQNKTKSSKSSPEKETEDEEGTSGKKRKKAAPHQRVTDRDPIPKLWNGEEAFATRGSYTFKIMSWNVAGLRAVMKNHPDALKTLVQSYHPDILCLQETKLQDVHLEDPKIGINETLLTEEGYDGHFTCATVKKGYSGTAVFIKRRTGGTAVSKDGKKKKKQATLGAFRKEAPKVEESNPSDANPMEQQFLNDLIPSDISFAIGKKEHDGEGRFISIEYPLFTLVNVYVPNSGDKLVRLDYRTEQWDTDFLQYMQRKQEERKLPVIWIGDLNVAHTAMDVWNDGANHLKKTAGTTPEERMSFQRQLDAGFVDAFRCLHPEAWGHYSYWSQRAGNRPVNKGLRLDYFICSRSLMDEDHLKDGIKSDGSSKRVVVRDSYMIPDQVGSDHCPLMLELEIKKT